MNKIKKGDQVAVLCGNQKGARGVVKEVITGAGGKPEKVVVEGVRMLTHFERPDPQNNKPGGLAKYEAPVHVSNVALVGGDGRPARAKFAADADGKMRRTAGKEAA